MDTVLYQRDRGELDWDARSVATTAMFDDSASMYKAKPSGYDRYMTHGPALSNGSDIELSRMDTRDNAPLLDRPGGMARGFSDVPSRPSSRLAHEVDLGMSGRMTPQSQVYRQGSPAPMQRQGPPPGIYSQESQRPMLHAQGSEWSLPPSYQRAPSRQGSDMNMAGRGAFRG